MRKIIFSVLVVFSLTFASPEKIDEMLLKAWKYYEKGNYYMMLEEAEKIIRISEKENYQKGIAEGLYYVGIAYFQMGDINKAIEYANKAIEYTKDKPNYRWKSYAHNLLAEIMVYLKKYDKALSQYKTILNIAKKYKNEKMIAITYLSIGNIYFYKKDYKKALENYKKSHEYTRIADLRPYYIALINYNLGMAYYKLKKYFKAVKHFEKSAEIYKKIGDIKSSVESAYFLAKSYYKMENRNKALEIINKYKKFAKKVLLYRKFKKLEKKIRKED